MKSILKLLIYNISLTILVIAYDPITETPIHMNAASKTKQSANISPEIINELKDFEHLIPIATIDEIVAKYYLIDGNFRIALKYLRSYEFTQLQKELLTIPEIINVLDFLHVTTINVTTMHVGATKSAATLKASLDDYNDNRIDKTTTNIATNSDAAVTTTSNTYITTAAGAMTKKLDKRPQPPMEEKNNKVDVNNVVARTFIEQQPQVHFVLLDDSKAKIKAYDVVTGHNDKIISPTSPHHHHHQHGSLGTFTTFVEEVLQHLPNTAYQKMIKDKCKKTKKFAEFYKALRDPKLKPLVDEVMKTSDIMKIINNLNSYDIDVKSLEPIAFQVISWGPKI